MPEINIRVSHYFVESLSHLLERIAKTLRSELAISVRLVEQDEDLTAAWEEGLLEQLQDDCRKLMALFRGNQLGKTAVELDSDSADSILRAASAVRIRIRETFLNGLSEEDLEQGEVDFYSLEPDIQQTYACYVFLAGIQEQLVAQLEGFDDEGLYDPFADDDDN